MAAASLEGLAMQAPLREQLARLWSNWMSWAMSNPGKRRALARLDVSGDISLESRAASHQAMAEVAGVLQRARACPILSCYLRDPDQNLIELSNYAG